MKNIVLIFEKGNGVLLRILTTFFAVLFHAGIIGSLIIIPLIGTQETPPLKKIETLPVIILPPAPPAGQPLGGGVKRDNRETLKTEERGFFASIPETLVEGENPELESGAEIGNGVPWGVAGGSPEGVPWGIPYGSIPTPEFKKIEPLEGSKAIFVHKPPKLIKKVEPVYPEIAIISRIQGDVVLEATTDINGRVQDIRIVKSDHPILEKSAMEALRQWIYEPYLVNGRPRPVVFIVTIKFMLQR